MSNNAGSRQWQWKQKFIHPLEGENRYVLRGEGTTLTEDENREAELDQSRELQKQLRERERERERCYDPLQVACNSLSIDYNCHKLFVNSLSRYSKACFFFFFWALCC